MTGIYNNKYFSVLGDSMSTLQGYSTPEDAAFYAYGRCREFGVFVPEDTWWGQVIEALGGRLLVCDAFSGSTVTRDPMCDYPSYGCSDERTSSLHRGDTCPDVIMILMGANDRGMRVAAKGEQDWTFEGAYRLMLQKLRRRYPRAEIWCLTLPTPRDAPLTDPDPYCQAVRDVGIQTGYRVLELASLDVRYPSPDNLHPDREGMCIIAERILSQII